MPNYFCYACNQATDIVDQDLVVCRRCCSEFVEERHELEIEEEQFVHPLMAILNTITTEYAEPRERYNQFRPNAEGGDNYSFQNEPSRLRNRAQTPQEAVVSNIFMMLANSQAGGSRRRDRQRNSTPHMESTTGIPGTFPDARLEANDDEGEGSDMEEPYAESTTRSLENRPFERALFYQTDDQASGMRPNMILFFLNHIQQSMETDEQFGELMRQIMDPNHNPSGPQVPKLVT